MKQRVAIALGSNDADAAVRVRAAYAELNSILTEACLSPLYASAPMYYEDQPRFVNAVMVGETVLAPSELLALLKTLERQMGRVTTFQNGPRVIDLDIVLYGDAINAGDILTIPHPRMAERPFVMVPLARIAPDWVHPVTGQTAQAMADALVFEAGDLHELA